MREIINNNWEFTSHWSDAFLHGAKGEEIVRIPHTVKEVPLHYADPDSYQMIAGYRKTLSFKDKDKNKRYFLIFEAAAHIATVWFNGKELGTHCNGYTSFRYEITGLVDFEKDNVVTVRLDTTENPSVPPFGFVIDYLTYGGIYRNVILEEREQNYIKDAFLKTPNLHTLDIDVQVEGKEETITVELLKDGKVLAEKEKKGENGTVSLIVDGAEPWSPEHPALYTCRLTYGKDVQEYTFGFRTIAVDENHFLLNGEPYFVRGLNRHQCFPYAGYAVPDALQVEDARILKEELGVNAVRTSHYPQSHAFLDACDRLGLLVFTEIPGWQHLGDDAWKRQAIENTKEMVREYRNHVSIFMWGVRVNESLDDDALYMATNEAARRLDPTRPTSGVRYLEKSSLKEDVYAYNDFSHIGTNKGVKAKKDVTPDVKKPLIVSEANGHMFPTKSYDKWERRQEHALRHARVLNDAIADGQHAGCFQWCMFDYATHKDFGSGDRICYHGVLDSFRNPKLAASVYASQQEETPVLEIGSSMDIGDYDGGTIQETYAFTNADCVRLYKNDDFVKEFRPDHEKWKGLKHPPILIDDMIGELLQNNEGFTGQKEKLIREAMNAAGRYGMANLPAKYVAMLGWVMLRYHLKYSDGVALYSKYVGSWGGDATVWKFEAVKDGKVVKTVVKSPRTKLHLETKVSHTLLHEGDTYDMASIRIRLLDELDNLASYAQLPVEIKVEGPVEIVGPHVAALEGGMSGTYIRTTGETGKAAVTLTTGQTEPVQIQFEIQK